MRTIAVALFALAMISGCDKGDDKFEAVDPITAPVSDGTNEPVADKAMPVGHPPVGSEQVIPKPTTVTYASPAEYGKTGPLTWTAPASWQASKPGSNMRLAEYIVPGAPEAGVLSIFYFGASGGGGVDANVKRWVGQFDGGKASPTMGEETVNGMKVHTVDVSGTYNPGMAGGGAPPQDGHRMLGAIVESPAGLFFFKLVGPAATVTAAESDWKNFVASLKGQ